MVTTTHDEVPSRDAWVMAGMAVAAASAAVASFTGLRGLAVVAGWPGRLAWLLPITIDAYAMTSARVWLAGTTRSRRARRFARANATGAISASILGNAAYHAISAHLLTVSWPIVVVVGAVPAAVLGLTAHLHALRTIQPDGAPGMESGTEDRTEDGTEIRTNIRTRPRQKRRAKTRTENELMTAARTADEQYRAAQNGRPITRDALRTALRVSGAKATELRRRLAAEMTDQQDHERREHE
jgi:hypothetical protein